MKIKRGYKMKIMGTIQQKQLTIKALLSYGYIIGTNEYSQVSIDKSMS